MNEHTVRLWYAYPDDLLDIALAESCRSLLSRDEIQRLEFVRFEKDRREFLAGRVNLRVALSQCISVAPGEWRFRTNKWGKPETDPDCGLRFNVSHSSALAICAITRGINIGVDVESVDRSGEILSIATDVFSPAELAQFAALTSEEQADRNLSLWTLKEAWVKARGMGLSLPLTDFSFLFHGPEQIRLTLDPSLDDDARHFRFCLLNHAAHRIAVVVEGAAVPELQVWQNSPLPGSPARIACERVRWF